MRGRWRTVGALLVAFVAVVIAGLFLAGAIPYRVYVVHTGSMAPAAPSGSAVIVHLHHYQVGQPVSFTVSGSTITHRLIAINTDGTITTKGDANRAEDPFHARQVDIIGGVVATPTHLGRVLVFLGRTPTGAAGIVLFALALFQINGLSRAFVQRPTGGILLPDGRGLGVAAVPGGRVIGIATVAGAPDRGVAAVAAGRNPPQRTQLQAGLGELLSRDPASYRADPAGN